MIEQIVNQMNDVKNSTLESVNIFSDNASKVGEIVSQMDEMNSAASSNARSISDITEAVMHLNNVAKSLKTEVDGFRM